MTHNVLEAMDDAGVSKIAFTSSSTVYSEAPRSTPEDYAPLEPISVHDTSTLADIVGDELGYLANQYRKLQRDTDLDELPSPLWEWLCRCRL